MMYKTFTSFKRAFTMLELVLVITILGIVASIGSSAIANVYESYIVQRAVHRASNKAELAAMQIANRLAYRISSSVIGRVGPATTPVPLEQVPDDSYNVLEWIAYDNDSFSAQSTPGWSGYCDLNDTVNTTKTTISTPGSNLSTTNSIIGELSSGTKNISNAAIIFDGHEYSPTTNYIAGCMGFTDSTCISPVASVSGTTITIEDNNEKVMTDQYKLAWSAYALVPVGNTLTLRYNYQPWDGTQSSNGSSRVLVDKFVSFRFKGDGDTIRFKLCIEEEIAADEKITICKEKAVIR
ncbi:type II secretion system protein [Sulfurovum sp. XTW-4]|uniref:Type II secretion system protein n=1 Tax=Sulfurovum xiamenensis TaxID=3019066 RepID=A0ABT7QQ59_9BACT|nr:type II secretion system protein [Sulfurovum xiamenensis]MDM5262897.1 type II secretion system protein [Sulfurovum xiamenensis]